ncbi:MAG: transposase family protein [Micromonosporaceae bacterium]|nr:transposase family protein [Micromonosporaceae bacterium]
MPASPSSLIDYVRDQPGVPQHPLKLGHISQDLLLTALSRVPDPRDARGIRHPAPTVLALAVAAVLAGSRSFYAIGQWIAGAKQKTLTTLGARQDPRTGRYQGPDEKTVRKWHTDACWRPRPSPGPAGDRPKAPRPAAGRKPLASGEPAAASKAAIGPHAQLWPWTARPPGVPGPPIPEPRTWSRPSPTPAASWPSGRSPRRATRSPRSSPCWNRCRWPELW